MSPDRLMLMLLELRRQGVRTVETPNYSPAAEWFGDLVILGPSMEGLDTVGSRMKTATLQEHRIAEIVTWQHTVYVSNLLTLGAIANIEALLLDEQIGNYVFLVDGLPILFDGNHRFWWLWHRGVQTARFRTVMWDSYDTSLRAHDYVMLADNTDVVLEAVVGGVALAYDAAGRRAIRLSDVVHLHYNLDEEREQEREDTCALRATS